MKQNALLILIIVLCYFALPGCVERLIAITTEPEGAMVWLNDEEVGATPVTVPFTWYGQYEVVIRREGFQTLKTSRRTPVPFYQWPAIDFFSEALLPARLTDRHEWHFPLERSRVADRAALIRRAAALRNEALDRNP